MFHDINVISEDIFLTAIKLLYTSRFLKQVITMWKTFSIPLFHKVEKYVHHTAVLINSLSLHRQYSLCGWCLLDGRWTQALRLYQSPCTCLDLWQWPLFQNGQQLLCSFDLSEVWWMRPPTEVASPETSAPWGPSSYWSCTCQVHKSSQQKFSINILHVHKTMTKRQTVEE